MISLVPVGANPFLLNVAMVLTALACVVSAVLLLQIRSGNRQPIQTRLDEIVLLRSTDIIETKIDIQEVEEDFTQNDKEKSKKAKNIMLGFFSVTPTITLQAMGISFAISSIAVGSLLDRLGWFPLIATVGIALATGTFAARFIYKRSQEKIRLAFLDRFPDAVDLIVRATKAGIPLGEAISSVGREAEEPIRSEFRRMADAMAVGVDFAQVLRITAKRVNLPDFQFFVVCLLIQKESGGQIAETLGTLASVLRKRKESRQKVRAMTAEPRLSGKIIAAIPVFIGGFMTVSNPGYLSLLLDDPEVQPFLVASVVMVTAGLLVIDTLTRFKQR